MLPTRNLRIGLRTLKRSPSFAASAISMMALGIGATTAVFSVLRGVLLTPLPFREPNRIVLFRADVPGYSHQAALNREEFYTLRDRTDLFESVAVINESDGNLTDPVQMEPVTAASASDNFLATLGVSPILGRTVSRKDIGKGFVNAVDITYEVWERRFQSDPHIIGRTIEVNNLPMQVAGVLPKGFKLYLGPDVIAPRIDVWYPRPEGYDRDDPFRGRIVIARLRSGVTLENARAAVDALATRLVDDYPSDYRNGRLRLSLSTLDQEVVSEVKPALAALTGAVAFVLLVACANLANLLLARASMRTRELAVRIAVGASRAHIVSQLATEGLIIGALGAVGGLLIANWSVDGLLLLAPANLPHREAVRVDGTVASFGIALSLLCAVTASMIPAWQASKTDSTPTLKQDPTSSHTGKAIRGLLTASQLALSLVLLIGAVLMGRAFIGLRVVPLGFDPDRVLTMTIALDARRFDPGTIEEARKFRLLFYQRLVDAVRQIPSIEQAGIGFPVPLKGTSLVQRFSTGIGEPERQGEPLIAFAGYLETLRVPLVAGRYFTKADDEQPVVIVDERLARELWPNQSAPGQRLVLLSPFAPRAVQVVGVVAHAQTQGLRSPGLPQIWMTYGLKGWVSQDLVVRGTNPMALAPAIKEAVQKLGTGRPVHDVRLLSEYVDNASADTRFALFVLGAFAVLALSLTAIGVYAVVAYATARRTREIALRLALGADAGRIISLVMRQGAGWIAGGLFAGLTGALFLTRYVSTLLFKITPTDLPTFLSVSSGLTVVALIALALPAIRALRIDPMLALRSE